MFAFMQRAAAAQDMSAQDAVAKAAAGEIVLIDVRDPMELRQSGKAKGALNLPSATLMMRADPRSPECVAELKEGKPIALYCASGARSAMAKQMLKRMGHEDVHNIGGLMHWQRAGGEVVSA
jgi:rhodanese-related sulfurtransferase